MSFRSRLELVTDLIARVDLTRAGLRMTFRISGITHYLGAAENVDQAAEKHTAFVDLPTSLTVQNGSVKLVLTQPEEKTRDASLIAAIARMLV